MLLMDFKLLSSSLFALLPLPLPRPLFPSSPYLLVTVVVVSVRRQIVGQTFDAQSAFVGGD